MRNPSSICPASLVLLIAACDPPGDDPSAPSTDTDAPSETVGSTTGEIMDSQTSSDSSSTGEPLLDGCGQPATLESHQGEIQTEVWTAGIHEVGSISIAGSLVVEPCSIVRMGASADIVVRSGASLTMQGTDDAKIWVTSEDALPGAWGHIRFEDGSTSTENRLEWVELEFGGGTTGDTMLWIEGGSAVSVARNTLTASRGTGARIESGAVVREFVDNTVVENNGAAIQVHASSAGSLGAGVYGPNARNGILVTEGVVEHDATWAITGAPYLVSGLSVSGGNSAATLEFGPGVEVRFSTDGTLIVGNNGGLRVAGSEEDPVVFTSENSAPEPGNWNEIRFQDGSIGTSNSLDHVMVRNGGAGDLGMIFVESGASVAVTNSVLERSSGPGMVVQNGGVLRTFEGNALVDNEGTALRLSADAVGSLGAGVYSPNGIDGIYVDGGVLTTDAGWATHDAPYLIEENVRLDAPAGSAVLTVDAGAQLLLGPGVQIRVEDHAALALAGTEQARIRLASSKATPAAGDWDYILFDGASAGPQNVWTHVDVAHGAGGGPQFAQVWVSTGGTLSVDDVTFAESATGCDIRLGPAATLNATNTTASQCD